MFDFRLITLADGNQIIDRNVKTPYEALTPLAMIEYIQVDNSLAYADRMEKQRRREAEKKNTFAYKLKLALSAALS